MEEFDILIAGAGPIGLACALKAEEEGFNYALFEKGCLTNSIYNYPVNMQFFSTSEKLEIGSVPFISHGSKPVRMEALEYYRRIAGQLDRNVRTYERVIALAKVGDGFLVSTSKGNYKSRFVIGATGFYDRPNMLNIPGEELEKVSHYYKEPHPYAFRKTLVAGGGNSAVDAALEIFRKGGDVTMVMINPSIEENVKYWVRPDILNRIEEGSITAYYNSRIVMIREHDVTVKTPDGIIHIENDFVLALTGYSPDYTWLHNAGVKIGDDPFKTPEFDNETHETNVPGLYLAGVVCGGLNTGKYFIENSREHAEKIINAIKAMDNC